MQSTSNDKEALPKAQLEANLHAEEVAIEEQAAQIRKEAQIKSKEHQSDDSDKSAKASSESKEVPTMPIVDKDDLAAKKQDSQPNNSQEPVQGSQTLENNGKADAEPKEINMEKEATKVEVTPAPMVTPQYVQGSVNSHIERELASIRRRTGSMTFLFFLFFVAIAGGIFYAVSNPEKLSFLQPQAQAPAVDPVKLAQVYTDIDRLKGELSTVKELTAANQQLQGDLKTLYVDFSNYKANQGENTKRLLALTEKLRGYELRDPDDWRIAQAYFLANNAFLMAVLNHDAKSAIWCLKDADALLVNLEEEPIIKIRQAISRDVLALSSLPDIDIRGIIFDLDSVYNNVPKMPLNDITSEEKRQALLQKKQGSDGNIANWKDNLLSSLEDFSSRFVEVRRRSDPMVNEFLSPEQANILQQNVQSEILMAKFAVINQNDQAFTNNLAQAIRLIEQYYDHNSDIYKANLAALNELKGMRVSTNVPAALQSYALFKDYAEDRLKISSKPKTEPKTSVTPAGSSASAPASVELPAAPAHKTEGNVPGSNKNSGAK